MKKKGLPVSYIGYLVKSVVFAAFIMCASIIAPLIASYLASVLGEASHYVFAFLAGFVICAALSEISKADEHLAEINTRNVSPIRREKAKRGHVK